MNDLIENIEHWRAAPSYPGYEVSDLGNIRRSDLYDPFGRLVETSKPVAQSLSGSPKWHPTRYMEVSLRVGPNIRRHCKVHHLVAEAFLGPRPDGLVCCHGPGGPLDNRVENLRWDTQASNIEDMHRARGGHHESLKITCLNGHDINDPENTYARGPGRKCKICARARARARHLGIDDYRTLL